MTDFSAFDEGTSTTPTLPSLIKLADEALALEAQIEDTETLLKAQKSRAHDIKTRLLPDAMAEAQLTQFATASGVTIKVEDFVSGSLPKESGKRDAAIKWLEANDGGDIIKNEISLSFEKSQHNEALALASDIRAQGYEVDVTSGVHPQTLMAWARERLKGGEALEPETLGLFVGRKASYKVPK